MPLQSAKSASSGATALTSRAVLVRSTAWNLVGDLAPLAVGIVTIRVLVTRLGADAYGLLTLAWAAVAYFGVFDFGLGRAAIKLIAEALGSGANGDVPAILWTTFYILGLCGAASGAFLTFISHWLVFHVLRLEFSLQYDACLSFYIVSLSLPFIFSTASLIALLSASQRFDLINLLGILNSLTWYVAPLLIVPFTHKVSYIVAVLVAGKIFGWCATIWLCLRVFPELMACMRPRRSVCAPLFTFGGWLTVSSITSPILSYFDRFVIGSIISPAAVAYYTVPYQVVTKVAIIPGAISRVLFPALSATLLNSRGRALAIFERSSRYIFIALLPIVVVMIVMGSRVITFWLGATFANHASATLKCLSVGIFWNGLAYVAYVLVQAANRPDLTAKLHVIELPIYLGMLWLLVSRLGLAGVALAWSLRVGLDLVLLCFCARALFPEASVAIMRTIWLGVMATALFVCGAIVSTRGVALGIVFIVGTLSMFALWSWFGLLAADERADVRSHLVAWCAYVQSTL